MSKKKEAVFSLRDLKSLKWYSTDKITPWTGTSMKVIKETLKKHKILKEFERVVFTPNPIFYISKNPEDANIGPTLQEGFEIVNMRSWLGKIGDFPEVKGKTLFLMSWMHMKKHNQSIIRYFEHSEVVYNISKPPKFAESV